MGKGTRAGSFRRALTSLSWLAVATASGCAWDQHARPTRDAEPLALPSMVLRVPAPAAGWQVARRFDASGRGFMRRVRDRRGLDQLRARRRRRKHLGLRRHGAGAATVRRRRGGHRLGRRRVDARVADRGGRPRGRRRRWPALGRPSVGDARAGGGPRAAPLERRRLRGGPGADVAGRPPDAARHRPLPAARPRARRRRGVGAVPGARGARRLQPSVDALTATSPPAPAGERGRAPAAPWPPGCGAARRSCAGSGSPRPRGRRP